VPQTQPPVVVMIRDTETKLFGVVYRREGDSTQRLGVCLSGRGRQESEKRKVDTGASDVPNLLGKILFFGRNRRFC
jgi:hypothetical protein